MFSILIITLPTSQIFSILQSFFQLPVHLKHETGLYSAKQSIQHSQKSHDLMQLDQT